MQTVISVTNLSKHFKDAVAVDDLSFAVYRGDIYGFLGQNGAGKSTTIRMLLSLIRPTSGRIELFGMNLRTHRLDILTQVGAIIEKPDTYKYLTAFENISLFANMSGVKIPKKRLMEKLELVDLAERANSRVKTFSQGMKQRLGIAIALVHDPGLLILDEPTNGLDPQGIADMRNLILDLSRNHQKTILVSSHLLSEIEVMANRMMIIDKGKKVIEGQVSNLLDGTNMIVELQTTEADKTFQVLENSKWKSYLRSRQNGKFIFEMDKIQIPALNKDLVEQGIGVLHLQPRHSLEDYFLSITTSPHVEAAAN
ncbi:MAG: bacitracin ABC transporter ATP-binding protein [Bacteroidetes bacterium]|nr:MAG: bacitracin ABC transporter ATP-binding protein [Bacteroidota bacterium]